jgi:hypothetical protein
MKARGHDNAFALKVRRMSQDFNFDFWPEAVGPYIRYDPDAVLPPPRPPNPFDTIAPEDLFAAGVTPECYLCWRSGKDRRLIHWAMTNHPGLTLAEALSHCWWWGGL